MQTTQYPLSGDRVIILDKIIRDADFGIFRLVIGFKERSAWISMNFGHNHIHTR